MLHQQRNWFERVLEKSLENVANTKYDNILHVMPLDLVYFGHMHYITSLYLSCELIYFNIQLNNSSL